MDYSNIIIAACAAIGTIVTILGFLGKKFDKIDEKLDKIDRDITDLKVQVGKLETRVEERTLRVIHTERSTTL